MFRELIRKNKQLSNETCISILKEEKRGVLSVIGDDGYPYGMPMNHWYEDEDGCIYFHSGNGGHRLDSLKRCSKASYCVYDGGYRADGEWAYRVKSVIAFGNVEILDDPALIRDITTKLSHKFIQDDAYIEREIAGHAHRTRILRFRPAHICGKLVTEA